MSAADELELRNPLAEWAAMMAKVRRGEQIDPADVVPPPPVNLGVTLRSATRRYADSETGIGLGGVFYDWGPVNDDGEPSYRVVEVKANPGGGTRVEWHVLSADEILWEEFSGIPLQKVLKDLRRDLIAHMRRHSDDTRYLVVLGVIAACLA